MNQITEHGCLYSAEDKTLTAACKRLLQQQSFSTQNQLREKLVDIGYTGISQSTVSRILSQLGVVKIQNACGKRFTASRLKARLCVSMPQSHHKSN